MIMVDRKPVNGRPRKLSAGDVDKIVTRFNGGETITSLAKAFRVSRTTIQRTLRERSVAK